MCCWERRSSEPGELNFLRQANQWFGADIGLSSINRRTVAHSDLVTLVPTKGCSHIVEGDFQNLRGGGSYRKAINYLASIFVFGPLDVL